MLCWLDSLSIPPLSEFSEHRLRLRRWYVLLLVHFYSQDFSLRTYAGSPPTHIPRHTSMSILVSQAMLVV